MATISALGANVSINMIISVYQQLADIVSNLNYENKAVWEMDECTVVMSI